jgi:SNF2 family DNA or RNA helicase
MKPDYIFGGPDPFDHQRERFYLYRDKEFHAHEWEQGTGKSKLIIDTGCWLYLNDKIGAVFVVSVNGVHRNWILNEYPIHCPDNVDYMGAWYSSMPRAKERKDLEKVLKHDGLIVVAQNVEALSTKKGQTFLKNFLLDHRTLLVVDDADIENPFAIRTKALVDDMSGLATYRRVLNGTPITQGPMDVFAPYTFLSHTILGTSSYYAFRSTYAIMKTIEVHDKRYPNDYSKRRRVKIIDSYKNMDRLKVLLDPHRDRVLKIDTDLNLPPKLYQKRYVELSNKQRVIYATMKKHLIAELDGSYMTAPLALTKLLRLQQVTGGFFVKDSAPKYDDDNIPIITAKAEPVAIDKTNKRVDCLMDIVKETKGKIIIRSRFRAEIEAISDALRKKYGKDSVVEYHGGVDDDTRTDNIAKFQDQSSPARFFNAQAKAGSKGLTLHAAKTVIYFSNSFSLKDRLQSEDRSHRAGMTDESVLYIDIIAPDTMDETIVNSLRGKKNVADLLTGDTPLRSWL